MEKIKDILTNVLKMDASKHIESVARFGKVRDDNKCRSIRVVVKTIDGKREILKRAKS